MTIRATPTSEFRTLVYALPDTAPEVPLPYGGGHILPSHIRIEISRMANTGRCSGKARVFGMWRDPGGDLTTELQDAEFRLDGHWAPDWVGAMIRSACPIGWKLTP